MDFGHVKSEILAQLVSMQLKLGFLSRIIYAHWAKTSDMVSLIKTWLTYWNIYGLQLFWFVSLRTKLCHLTKLDCLYLETVLILKKYFFFETWYYVFNGVWGHEFYLYLICLVWLSKTNFCLPEPLPQREKLDLGQVFSL